MVEDARPGSPARSPEAAFASVLSVALLLAACAPAEAPRPEGLTPPEVADSAGVRIVTNRVPDRGFPAYATLEPVPTLDVGPDQDPALADVVGLATLSDGRVAVGNRGTFEVRYYRPDGAPAGASGSEGADAGEFREVTSIGAVRGDTVWVFDVRSDRLTMLRPPDGWAERTADVPGNSILQGRFGDGSYLLVPQWSDTLRNRADTGTTRDTARWIRWWPATGDTVGIGTFPYGEQHQIRGWGRVIIGAPPFARETSIAVGPGRLYVGEQETFEYRGYDPDGALREIVRLEGVDLTLTPEQVAAARRLPGATTVEDGPWVEEFWKAVTPTRPAYSRFLLDAGGNLWVGEHVAGFAPPRTFLVFAPDGATLGYVQVPANFVPHEIGWDWVLGVWGDLAGRLHVRRYRLTRGGAAP